MRMVDLTNQKFGKILVLERDYSKIEEYYKEVPALLDYKNFFIEIFRYKDHVLSEKEETIISKLSNVLSNAEDTYEKLTDTDLSLGEIKDEEGNDIITIHEKKYDKTGKLTSIEYSCTECKVKNKKHTF